MNANLFGFKSEMSRKWHLQMNKFKRLTALSYRLCWKFENLCSRRHLLNITNTAMLEERELVELASLAPLVVLVSRY